MLNYFHEGPRLQRFVSQQLAGGPLIYRTYRELTEIHVHCTCLSQGDLPTEHQCICSVSPGGPLGVLHPCISPLGLLVAPWWRAAKPRFSPPTPVLPNFGRFTKKNAGKLVVKRKPPKTSCARGDTICPAPLLPAWTPKPSRAAEQTQRCSTFPRRIPSQADRCSRLLRDKAALSKAAW